MGVVERDRHTRLDTISRATLRNLAFIVACTLAALSARSEAADKEAVVAMRVTKRLEKGGLSPDALVQ